MAVPQHGYEFIQTNYGLNIGKGTRIRIREHPDVGSDAGRTGTVVGADKYVYVRFDGEPKSAEPFHPADIVLRV